MNERHIRTTEQIADLYDRINARWFDGQLIRPEIIMQGTSRIWCHYTLHDAFSGDQAGKANSASNTGIGVLWPVGIGRNAGT